jgi:hypothetical protein
MEMDRQGSTMMATPWYVVGHLYMMGIQILLSGNALKNSLASIRGHNPTYHYYSGAPTIRGRDPYYYTMNDTPVNVHPDKWWEKFKNGMLDAMRPRQTNNDPNNIYTQWGIYFDDFGLGDALEQGVNNTRVVSKVFSLASKHLRTGECD